MYSLKGFTRIASLVNNTIGTISPIGELSTWSLTYSRDIGEYFNTTYPGLSLVSFFSTDSVTGKKPVDTVFSDHMLTVSNWIIEYGYTKGGLITSEDFNVDILNFFQGNISGVNFGPIVNNGTLYLPAWISWSNPALPENNLKLWFSDSHFSQGYDKFEIVIIPPISNLDDFFLSPAAVQIAINSRTISETVDIIQVAKNNNPETVIRVNSYDYKNSAFPNITFTTNWSILIYGIAGDNIDSIKDALISYILSNSTKTLSQWIAILPDLFKRTEFNILPRWDKYAIPNLTIQPGIHSPNVNFIESAVFAKATLINYPVAHIDNYISSFGVSYKSLAVLCISNPENLNNKYNITDVFPDYINVGTSSLDFNRMGLQTQEWSIILEKLIIAAETVGLYSDLPPGIRRVIRDNKFYVASVYNNIQYLVSAKINYPII